MLRKLLCVAVVALLASPALVKAEFQAGDWELTLGANGSNSADFDGFNAGGNASIGYFFTPELELALRQSLNYTDLTGGGEGAAWNGTTRLALDYHFDMGQWRPFIGANLGYIYGDTTADTWEAAPEAGVKYFVNSTTFIFGLAEYQFFFDEADEADDAFDDGQFVYTVGIGFRF